VYKSFLKPILDFFISGIALLLLLPFLILISFIIILVSGSYPFFLQKRTGKNEAIFTIIKFKTMNNKCDEKGVLLPDSNRLTGIGKFMRKTSLDEIPQLINVLKNDMSLIGPRPLLPEYLPLYNDFQKQRHQIKPGITGWAQINGRNNISWNDKFELDVYYVNHISFLLDLKIVIQTIIKVFSRKDIYIGKGETMNRFKGNQSN
jgi:lipopolysaccharide/colanic/teichoic acid biosynthesis glycosyltransferase